MTVSITDSEISISLGVAAEFLTRKHSNMSTKPVIIAIAKKIPAAMPPPPDNDALNKPKQNDTIITTTLNTNIGL